jgi:hypothetical protein
MELVTLAHLASSSLRRYLRRAVARHSLIDGQHRGLRSVDGRPNQSIQLGKVPYSQSLADRKITARPHRATNAPFGDRELARRMKIKGLVGRSWAVPQAVRKIPPGILYEKLRTFRNLLVALACISA